MMANAIPVPPVMSSDQPPGSAIRIKKPKYNNFQDFLIKHSVKKPKSSDNLANVAINAAGAELIEPKTPTHTRIGDQANGIYGGSYHIPDDEYLTFMQLYHREVITKNAMEYLTEKQLTGENGINGPIAIDLDLHFALDLPERVYTHDHLEDLINGYLEVLKDIYQFDEDTRFSIFLFEKQDINRVSEKNITKDGIHIIIGIQMDRAAQCILRERMIPIVSEMWGDFPIVNKWTEVFDEGISVGCTNWQLFGSRKPHHTAYQLTRVYTITYDPDDGEFINTPVSPAEFLTEQNFIKFSVRYTQNPQYFYKTAFSKLLQTSKLGETATTSTRRSSAVAATSNLLLDAEMSSNDLTRQYMQIRNRDDLDMHLNQFLDNIQPHQYDLRETYEFVMVLPEIYYGEGSFSKWIRVGWALKNTSMRLLIVWIAFSAKSPSFNFADVPDLCDRWSNFEKRTDGLTKASIKRWAKNDNREGFDNVHKNTVGHFIDLTISAVTINTINSRDSNAKGCGDYDLALVLYHMYKDEYVCADVKLGVWYRFKNHRWKRIDTGCCLRLAISKDMRDLYNDRINELGRLKAIIPDEESERIKMVEGRMTIIINILKRLGQTNDKKNIMTEAKDLFYDSEFQNKLDSNPYLLGCKNGVFDFKEDIFRKGQPEDYLTKCTNIDYNDIKSKKHDGVMEEIHKFMAELFPCENLRKYMWEHLASTLIGVASVNQTFTNYIGIGANGKSVLTDLMSRTLGEYKGSAPISMITQARGKIGGLSPEVAALKGLRYVVMQEPSKGDMIQEGPMKELVSGVEPITARGLFQDITTFVPQFKLVVCANIFMGCKSQDHGTWRRIHVAMFQSLFTDNPVNDDPDKPYQFKIDRYLTEKFEVWSETFLAMLVDVARRTKGVVGECAEVMEASNAYRERQDYLAEFIRDKVEASAGSIIRKSQLSEEFKVWYNVNYGTRSPSTKDLHEYMDKRFGKQKAGVWSGVKLKFHVEQDEEADANQYLNNEDNDPIHEI